MRKEKREEIRREERRDGGDEQRRGDESRVVNAKMREESFRIEPPLHEAYFPRGQSGQMRCTREDIYIDL